MNSHNGLPVSGLVYSIYFAIVVAGPRQWIIKARATKNSFGQPVPAAATTLKEVTV